MEILSGVVLGAVLAWGTILLSRWRTCRRCGRRWTDHACAAQTTTGTLRTCYGCDAPLTTRTLRQADGRWLCPTCQGQQAA